MKEIIILSIASALSLLLFILTLFLGFVKKDKNYKRMATVLFFVFSGLTIYTGYKLFAGSYRTITKFFRPRTGDEIYEALFEKKQRDCVRILNYRDQLVPKIDNAIWLHFETCPEELKRILSRQKYSGQKLSSADWDNTVSADQTLNLFNPKSLGDTIMVYECIITEGKNIQTIWTNTAGTKAIVRDILD
jgi:hypothetical protein